MEIIVSVFAAAVAMSCLLFLVRSELQDRKKAVRLERQAGDLS